MAIEDWSLTASTNATADASINWAEGQAPSTVNNSARAMMAAGAAWLRSIGATGTVGGSADAITLTTDQTPTALGPAVIGFFATGTNTGAVTINRDGLGAKPFRPSSGVEFAAGEVISGRYYLACYTTASSGQWIALTGGTLKSYVDAADVTAIASAASAAAGLYVPLTRTVSPGTGMSGGGALSGNITLTLADTAVSAGSYTRATITVDAQGRLTAASAGASELPSQTGNSGKVLTTDGSNASWSNESITSASASCINLATAPAIDTGSFNAASCSVPSTGKVRLTFTNALTAKTRVYASHDTLGIAYYVSAKTTTYVEVQFFNSASGASTLPANCDITVFGGA